MVEDEWQPAKVFENKSGQVTFLTFQDKVCALLLVFQTEYLTHCLANYVLQNHGLLNLFRFILLQNQSDIS